MPQGVTSDANTTDLNRTRTISGNRSMIADDPGVWWQSHKESPCLRAFRLSCYTRNQMCGIAGIVGRNALSEAELNELDVVNDLLIHRGPNGVGRFRSSNVALAMRRLSIIDLEGGFQPLYNEDRTLALVANGEIYNFVELREQLEA